MVGNLTVIIPFYNGEKYLDRLIQSLPRELPVILVDDHSEQALDTWWFLPSRGRGSGEIKIIRPEEKGYFSGAVNAGIRACDTDVLVLNQDVYFTNHHAFGLVDDYRNEGYAFLGERIKGTHPAFGDFGYIHGTFMFIRRDAIQRVGLLNEKLYPLWGSTAEYQWRMARHDYAVQPLHTIPGFVHAREESERYGSSIRHLLDHMGTQEKTRMVRTPPLLSIVVPCYNYGRYLADCISSLIGGPSSLGEMKPQTLQSFEVIIVNDASTDDSADYINKVVSTTKGIRAYHLGTNVGTARALNYGIEKSCGKYVTFLSADDMREPWSLEGLVQTCEENPHSFAYDDVWLFYKHKRIQEWRMQDYDFEVLLWKNQVHAGIVFPRKAWEEVGGYPAVMDNGREDWAFNVALGIKGWCGVHMHDFGYLYRRENQNRSLTNTTQAHRDIFLEKLRKLFPEIYGGQRPMACCGKGGNRARATATSNIAARKASTKSLTTLSMTGGTNLVANTVGTTGMVKVKYLGKQQSTIWDGPTTQVRYRFGVDRQVGWVDPRDAGERGSSGFLKLKDRHDNWLFEVVETGESNGSGQVTSLPKPEGVETQPVLQVAEPDAFSATVVEDGTPVMTLVADPAEKADAVSALVVEVPEKPSVQFPDPSKLYPSDVKVLKLTREQWQALYEAELSGKNRKSIITFVEEILASE